MMTGVGTWTWTSNDFIPDHDLTSPADFGTCINVKYLI